MTKYIAKSTLKVSGGFPIAACLLLAVGCICLLMILPGLSEAQFHGNAQASFSVQGQWPSPIPSIGLPPPPNNGIQAEMVGQHNGVTGPWWQQGRTSPGGVRTW